MSQPHQSRRGSAMETRSRHQMAQDQPYGAIPMDAWRYIAPLIQFAQHEYGATKGIGDRFSRQVATVTHGRAQLLLYRNEAPSLSIDRDSATSLVLPIQHAGIIYGSLVINREEGDPQEFGLPLEICAHLARVCGWLLHVLNEGAVLQLQSQHLEMADKDRKLGRRQRDVLMRMVCGRDRDSIARELGITSATVDSHRQAIYERLGVRSTTEAVLIAHKSGLVRCVAIPEHQLRDRAEASDDISRANAGGRLMSGHEK